MLEVRAGSALDERAQNALGARRRRLRLLAAGCVALFVLGISVLSKHGAGIDELRRTGIRIGGTVVECVCRSSVTVEYVWSDGVTRRKKVYLSSGSRRYLVGETVTVIVDADDPEHITLPHERNEPPLLVAAIGAPLLGGMCGLCLALFFLWRVRQQRRVLALAHWSRHRVQWLRARRRWWCQRPPRLAIELAPDRWSEGRIDAQTARYTPAPLAAAEELEIASGPRHQLVVRVPQTDALYSGRLGGDVNLAAETILRRGTPPTPAKLARQWRRVRSNALLACGAAVVLAALGLNRPAITLGLCGLPLLVVAEMQRRKSERLAAARD